MCCCPPPPGARRTAPSPTPSGASRASAPSCRCRARRSRTGGSSREVARRLGYGDAFAYRSAADVFREHAALSAFENDGARDFDLGGLAAISDEDYDALEPVQWPVRAGEPRRHRRACSPTAVSSRPTARRASSRRSRRRCARRPAPNIPLRLNTGRVRDQWHTMTRTGQSPRLGAHMPEPFVEIHPPTPGATDLRNDGFARSDSRHGACTLKVVISGGQQRGSLFVPIHWSGENASCGARRRSGRAADRSVLRPARGQGDAGRRRAGRLRLSRLCAARVEPLALPDGTWWARVALPGAHRHRCSRPTTRPMAWHDRAPDLFPQARSSTEYVDRAHGIYRAAAFVDGRLEGALFVGPARDATAAMGAMLAPDGRRAPRASPKSGPVICACFGVGLAAIHEALASRKAANVEEIGTGAARRHQLRLLPAGTEEDRGP